MRGAHQALERSYAMTDKKMQLLDEYMNYVADLVTAVLLRAKLGGASLSWFGVLVPIWVAAGTNAISRCRNMFAHFAMLRVVDADSRRRRAALYQHSLALFALVTRCAFTVLVGYKLTSPDVFGYWVMFSPWWVAPPLAATAALRMQMLLLPADGPAPSRAALCTSFLLATAVGVTVPLLVCRKLTTPSVFTWSALMSPAWLIFAVVLAAAAMVVLGWICVHLSRRVERRLYPRSSFNIWMAATVLVVVVVLPLLWAAVLLARRLDGDAAVDAKDIVDHYLMSMCMFLFIAWPIYAMYALQRTQRRLDDGGYQRGAAGGGGNGRMGGDMALLEELIRQLQQLAAHEGAQSEHDEGQHSITEHTKACTVARDGAATFRVVGEGTAFAGAPAPTAATEAIAAGAASAALAAPSPSGGAGAGGAGQGSAGRSASIAVDDDGGAECIVCMQNACSAVLIPCGHGDFCFECAKQVATRKAECPVCRTPIREALRYDGIADALEAASSGGGGDSVRTFSTRGGFTVNRVDADDAARNRARANLAAAIINEALAQRINAEAQV